MGKLCYVGIKTDVVESGSNDMEGCSEHSREKMRLWHAS